MFLCSFPAIQTAIKIHGSGDGMRIQLEIPESEMEEAKKLFDWRQKVLAVAIEPVDEVADVESVDDDPQRERRELHI